MTHDAYSHSLEGVDPTVEGRVPLFISNKGLEGVFTRQQLDDGVCMRTQKPL